MGRCGLRKCGEKLRKPFWSLIQFLFSRFSDQLEKSIYVGESEPEMQRVRKSQIHLSQNEAQTPAHLWLLRTPRLFALLNYITQDGSKNTAYWDGTWSYCSTEIHLIIDQELLRVKIYWVQFGHKSNIATSPMNVSKVDCKVNLQWKTTFTLKAIKWLQKTLKMTQKLYGLLLKYLLFVILELENTSTHSVPLDWKELPRYSLKNLYLLHSTQISHESFKWSFLSDLPLDFF